MLGIVPDRRVFEFGVYDLQAFSLGIVVKDTSAVAARGRRSPTGGRRSGSGVRLPCTFLWRILGVTEYFTAPPRRPQPAGWVSRAACPVNRRVLPCLIPVSITLPAPAPPACTAWPIGSGAIPTTTVCWCACTA
ncbi:hypothetical protein RAN3_1743 [plant metagenome]|uniref:Uncharacterized protein n=1 Tax=plant metagenome TaxID=1297885 RepID=A0A484PFE2_9ZZZZ